MNRTLFLCGNRHGHKIFERIFFNKALIFSEKVCKIARDNSMKILDIKVKYSEVCDAVKSVNINKMWKIYNGKIEVVSFT